MSAKEARKLGQRNQAENRSLLNKGKASEEQEDLARTLQIVSQDEFRPATTSETAVFPNLLEAKPDFRDILGLGKMETPQDRFLVVGGLDGFTKVMKEHSICGASPILMNHFMELIADTEAAELQLIKLASDMGVILDIAFFNKLIKRRGFRRDYKMGLDTISLMAQHHLEPDILTYGALAICCRSLKESVDLIKDMRDMEIT